MRGVNPKDACGLMDFHQPKNAGPIGRRWYNDAMKPPTSFLRRRLVFLLSFVCLAAQLLAQAPPATPAPAPKPKPTPPPVLDKLGIKLIPQPGVTIPEGDRSELQAGVTALGKEITVLKHNLKDKPELLALLPDVMIFHKAVDWALRYNEFFD